MTNPNLINQTLQVLAKLLDQNRKQILEANQIDIDSLTNPPAEILDRLALNDKKIDSLCNSVETVTAKDFPFGQSIYEYTHPNGMLIQNKTVPFGKILIIYEARPDVTIEASLASFKSGNKTYLKGGKESKNTNLYLVDLWHQALTTTGLDIDHINYLDYDRAQTQDLIQYNFLKLDLLVPRGGQSLIDYVEANSRIPVLVSGRGNNFIYIDSDCDFQMACNIALNGKTRLSVCNALDKILINKNLPDVQTKIDTLKDLFVQKGITVYDDPTDDKILAQEFLSAKIYIRLVDSIEQAIKLINEFSGGHSASIITQNQPNAQKFQDEVDCAAVYHNASVRFTDGFEFGFGAEMAIGTKKLHARGPIGLNQLVTNKWYIAGTGQIR